MIYITVRGYEKSEGAVGTDEVVKPKYDIIEVSTTEPCSCGAFTNSKYLCFAINNSLDGSFLADSEMDGDTIKKEYRYKFDYDTAGASCGDTIISTDIVDKSDDSNISALEA